MDKFKRILIAIIILFLLIAAIVAAGYAVKYYKQVEVLNSEIIELNEKITDLSAGNNIYSQDMFPTDLRMEQCINSQNTDEGINRCTNIAIAEWNGKISRYIKMLNNSIDKDGIQLLRNSQSKWEDFYKQEKEFLAKIAAKRNNSSVIINQIYELNRERAISLKGYLYQLSK